MMSGRLILIPLTDSIPSFCCCCCCWIKKLDLLSSGSSSFTLSESLHLNLNSAFLIADLKCSEKLSMSVDKDSMVSKRNFSLLHEWRYSEFRNEAHTKSNTYRIEDKLGLFRWFQAELFLNSVELGTFQGK